MNTAQALKETLISPNVADSNMEPANVVDVVNNVARGCFAIAKAIDNLAAAIRETSKP